MTYTAYIDRLSIGSILSLAISRKRYSSIFYFDAAPGMDKWSNVFVRLGLLKDRPREVMFTLAEITDDKGECQFTRITESIKDICLEIGAGEFAKNSFLKRHSAHFPIEKLVLFFEKAVSEKITDKTIFINVAKWHSERGLKGAEPAFFMQRDMWSKYLAAYAKGTGLRAVEYRGLRPGWLDEIRKKLFKKSQNTAPSANSRGTEQGAPKPGIFRNTAGRPLISSWYTGRTLTFSLTERSDFFWLLGSDIPRDQLLMHFDRVDIPVTREMVNGLERAGVRSAALSNKAASLSGMPVWKPGPAYGSTKSLFTRLLLKNILLETLKFRKVSFFHMSYMYYFITQYSYWLDFFRSNNIKVNVSPNNFTKLYVPKNIALERAGGVSVSYQWSVLNQSSIILSCTADAMFSFGPGGKRVWEENDSHIDNLICSGYVTDYSFKEVRERALSLRRSLTEKGVKFVCCFFDENSSDDRMSVLTTKKTKMIYEYFMKKALEDETLGIIFKPGYPKTLYSRLSGIGNLIEEAKKSGRCIVLDSGGYLTDKYPSEAAQASDLCVGFLFSGTASLEAYLSGTPTVFLDLEKLYSNPIYDRGRGKVVFDDMESLSRAIDKFRKDPGGFKGFGDLSEWARDKDPFKDGKASLRMGQYINWLIESFNNGMERHDAIRYANERYAMQWGKDKITSVRSAGRQDGSF